ncbi:protein phosphatase 2C 25 [Phytophthora cinnamomi]|uniref:protein phosphatase 2C 25 n=1 Tax=Phytophthora cinnamomi TaxID=4785 RepID=UPI0035594E51|nr:protein phosphatase 2C 25 [Phytophthora cinnamomi]
MSLPGLPPRHPPQPKAAPYVHLLELSSRCAGESRASRSAMDLSAVLGDRTALQQVVADLFRPFEALRVDQVVALLTEETITPAASGGADKATKKTQNGAAATVVAAESAESGPHRFTAAVAGAIAGAKQLAYGEVSVLRKKAGKAPKKHGRDATAPGKATIRTSKCKRVVTVDCAERPFSVEMKRKAIRSAARVLLVADWVSEVDSIFAARDALTRLGCDVVGASFVLATDANVLHSLKAAQVAFSCSWTPSHGASLNTSLPESGVSNGSASCTCHQTEANNGQSSRKRQRADIDSDPSVQVVLSHRTAEYQANNPSEDRSLNIVKATDDGVQINAVFDGHGGARAVEHLRASLCQRILAEVTSTNSSDEVSAIVKSAFSHCDEEMKKSLLALPPNVRKISKETQGLQAVEVSVDHSCNNPHEAKLVVERSHDRNAIRMSKDDQATGAGIVGVKRVAGSLAMTRAFGDFYLKCPELSSAPFKSKVPYITSEPSITTVYMDGSEKYVILASDGLWDVMTPQEAVHIVDKFDSEQTLFFSTASAALIHAALEKIAHRDGLMMHELMAMPQGPVRRRFHDDITCTVVYIDHQIGSQPAVASPSKTENTPEA